MDKNFCNEFINQLENLKKSDIKLEYFVIAAKDLMKYGEYKIAMENILSNFYDNSMLFDKHIIDLAVQAFGVEITEEEEILLKNLTKSEKCND